MNREISFVSIRTTLQVLDLKRTTADLMSIDNRRFMYHPSGILILGDEDKLHPGKKVYSSHAEEYGFASDSFAGKLPPYDEFCRGWIGVGRDYPHGIIHFAPQIISTCLSQFNAAFDFIEMAIQNGFTEECVLRGFCDKWEQTVSQMFGHEQHPSLENQIASANRRTFKEPAGKEISFSKGGAGR